MQWKRQIEVSFADREELREMERERANSEEYKQANYYPLHLSKCQHQTPPLPRIGRNVLPLSALLKGASREEGGDRHFQTQACTRT